MKSSILALISLALIIGLASCSSTPAALNIPTPRPGQLPFPEQAFKTLDATIKATDATLKYTFKYIQQSTVKNNYTNKDDETWCVAINEKIKQNNGAIVADHFTVSRRGSLWLVNLNLYPRFDAFPAARQIWKSLDCTW